MAPPPRKSSSGRKPASSASGDDLFSAAADAVPDAIEDTPTENWTLDDGPQHSPAKSASLPAPASLPPAGSVRISPISVPEKQMFESNPAAAEIIPEALLVPPRTAPAGPAPRPVVEAYDPFEIDEDLPAVAASPASYSAAPESTTAPVAAVSEYRRQAPQEDIPEPEEENPIPDRRPAAALSPVGMLAAAAVLLALLAGFIGILYLNRPASEVRHSHAEPTVPLAGSIATLSSIDSGWRTRQPGDLVSTVDVTLPTPSRQQSALLPMVKFTTDPSVTKAGFLRFIFLDPDGKISGDVRVLKVNGSSIEPLSSGAIVSGPGAVTVYGSLGFMDRPGFVAYATGDSTRWSVEVSESADYNAKEEAWNKLETFDLRNASDP